MTAVKVYNLPKIVNLKLLKVKSGILREKREAPCFIRWGSEKRVLIIKTLAKLYQLLTISNI